MEIISPAAAIILLAAQKVSPGAPLPRIFKEETLKTGATLCVMTTFTNWSARKEKGKTSGLISEEQKAH